jgi:hypothetical protein
MRQTVRVCHGSDPGVSHPHVGFLAPLELAGLLRPAAIPGSCSLQSVPLAFRSRAPRRGRWLPRRSSRPCPGAVLAVFHHRPSPTRATFGRRPWPDPAEARGSLSASLRAPSCDGSLRYASRSPWTSNTGLTSARSFRRLRSVLPCASPFTSSRRCDPSRGGRCSPGRSRPSRALLPPSLGPSTHPPRPEASLLPLVARASRRVARLRGSPCDRALLLACATSCSAAGDPRCRVEPCGDDRIIPHGTVGGHRILRTRAVPSTEDGSLDSHDLRCVALSRSARRVIATVIATSAHQA